MKKFEFMRTEENQSPEDFLKDLQSTAKAMVDEDVNLKEVQGAEGFILVVDGSKEDEEAIGDYAPMGHEDFDGVRYNLYMKVGEPFKEEVLKKD